MISNINTLAAMLMASIAFVACSSDSNEIEEVQAQSPQQYTMIVIANNSDEAKTRALSFNDNAVKTTWNDGEKVYVCRFQDSKYVSIGVLTAAASGNGTTKLTGTVTVPTSSPLSSNEELTYFLHDINWSYGQQNGELTGTNSIEDKHDFAMASSTGYTINGSQITDNITLSSQQAIFKFTLTDGTNPISANTLTISDSNDKLIQSEPHDGTAKTSGAVTVSTSGKSELYVALRNSYSGQSGSNNLTLTATTADGTYTCTKTNVSFTHGEYYPVTLKMTKN